MAESKQPKKRHVKAARDWLRKAEQSFERENEARGDLNLMLARAELARAAETQSAKRRGRWRLWLKECLAAVAAMLLVAAGAAFWRADTVPASAPLPAPPASQRQSAPPAAREAVSAAASAASETEVAAPLGQGIETTEKQEEKRAEARAATQAPAPDIALPDAQLRRLMRDAGKTLRGQPPLGNE